MVLVVDTADAFASETSRPSASSSNETHNVVSSAQDKVMSATLLEKTKLFRWRSKSIYSDDVAQKPKTGFRTMQFSTTKPMSSDVTVRPNRSVSDVCLEKLVAGLHYCALQPKVPDRTDQ